MEAKYEKIVIASNAKQSHQRSRSCKDCFPAFAGPSKPLLAMTHDEATTGRRNFAQMSLPLMRLLVAWLSTMLALLATPLQARDLSEIKQSGTLIAGTEGAYPPFTFFKGAALTGFEVELGQALAAKLGLKIDWQVLPFDTQLAALAQDRFDVAISSFGVTAERQKAVDFTDPHYCSGGEIVARAGGPRSASDLAGKTVAVQIGTTYAEQVKKVSRVGIVKTFPRDTDAQQNLLAGRVDAWVTDRFAALAIAARNPQFKLQLGDLLFTERVAIAVKKGNDSLRTALNRALAESLADGTYAAISQRWFKEDIRCR